MAFKIQLPDVDDIYAMADWLEMKVFIGKEPQISKAQLSDLLVAKIGTTPQELEVPIGLLFAEIGRRRRIAGKAYPIVVDDTMLKIDPDSNPEFYKFLLLVSLKDSPMRRGKKYDEADWLFDKLVCRAVKNHLGIGASSLRFGWPPSGGRPKTFDKALDWLSVQIGMPRGNGVSGRSMKDGGVDVVAWKPFPDSRTAFIVLLVQCTIQSNWFPKGNDIIEDVWRARIDAGRGSLTSLAVPAVIPKNFDKWDDLRRMVNIIFDRLRLSQVLADQDASEFTKMIRWSNRELKRFKF